MVLKSVSGLKFVSRPAQTSTFNKDPVANRRNNFIHGIGKQVDLLNGKETEKKIKPWFQSNGVGFIASLRYRNSPIELEGKNAFFEAGSKTALINVYKAVSKEVESGEWDQLLEVKSKSMKSGGRARPS